MEKEVTLEEVKSATLELRRMIEKNAIDPEKKARIDHVLDKYEDTNAKIIANEQKAKESEEKIRDLVKMLEEKDAKASEVRARVEAMEAELARKAEKKEVDYRDAPEYKALRAFVMNGDRISPEQKALLRTDSAVSGGYLTTTEMDSVITKKITELDGIRSIARVRSISSKAIEMAIRSTIPVADFEGEAETGTESQSTYENVTVTPFRQTFTTPITQDMLQDSAFNMEAELMSDAMEAFAYGEGNSHVLGNGFKVPEGFTVNSVIAAAARVSSASQTITASDIVLLTGDLKVGYNPSYVLNRRTLAFIRSLRDTNGQFLWMPGLNGGTANTLCGFPYVIANSMADHNAANALSVAFGDFRRGYVIVDRTGVSVIRDDVTQKRKAIVEFTMNRWTTGKVVLPEAIKLLKSAP